MQRGSERACRAGLPTRVTFTDVTTRIIGDLAVDHRPETALRRERFAAGLLGRRQHERPPPSLARCVTSFPMPPAPNPQVGAIGTAQMTGLLARPAPSPAEGAYYAGTPPPSTGKPTSRISTDDTRGTGTTASAAASRIRSGRGDSDSFGGPSRTRTLDPLIKSHFGQDGLDTIAQNPQ
jgi:hypothetical protein